MSPRTERAPAPAPPSEAEQQARLGPTFALYQAVVASGPYTPEWKYYGPKYGYTLKLFEKKRNLCFLNAYDGWFDVAFVFGDAAVEAALAGPLREELKDALRTAQRYPEGRGVKVSVRGAAELEDVLALLAIKRAPRAVRR